MVGEGTNNNLEREERCIHAYRLGRIVGKYKTSNVPGDKGRRRERKREERESKRIVVQSTSRLVTSSLARSFELDHWYQLLLL